MTKNQLSLFQAGQDLPLFQANEDEQPEPTVMACPRCGHDDVVELEQSLEIWGCRACGLQAHEYQYTTEYRSMSNIQRIRAHQKWEYRFALVYEETKWTRS